MEYPYTDVNFNKMFEKYIKGAVIPSQNYITSHDTDKNATDKVRKVGKKKRTKTAKGGTVKKSKVKKSKTKTVKQKAVKLAAPRKTNLG